MKKKTLWVVLGMLAASTAQAQIPVTDIASITTQITNQVQTIAQWSSQYSQMLQTIQNEQQQIAQLQQQYAAMTGSRGMGSLLSSSNALSTTLPPDWQNVLNNVKATAAYTTARAKYPTFSDSYPKANALYDVMASHDALTSELYTRSNTQMADIQSLMGQIDSASDPAAKADLMNRLEVQQNGLQGTQNLITLVAQKQKQELTQAGQAAAKEYSCSEFGTTGGGC